MQQEPARVLGQDLLLAGDQGDLVGALQLHHPVVDLARQQAQREADHAGRWPHIRSTARWVLPVLVGPRMAFSSAFIAPRSGGGGQSATFSGAWSADSARRARCPLRRKPGAGGRIRNLTLTSFLHNPRHLPGGVRGGVFKRARGPTGLVSSRRYQRRRAAGGGRARARRAVLRAPPPSAPPSASKADGRRDRVAELDLVVDLGQRIGSREWLRGLVTCVALCYAAWSLAPGLAAAARAPRRRPMPTPSSRKRARSPSRRSLMAATPAAGWRRPTRSSRSPRAPSGRSSTFAPPWAAATASPACSSAPASPPPRPTRSPP